MDGLEMRRVREGLGLSLRATAGAMVPHACASHLCQVENGQHRLGARYERRVIHALCDLDARRRKVIRALL